MMPRAPKPVTSVGQVFALVAGFLALAAIGAAIGWSLTDTGGGTPLSLSTSSPPATASQSPAPAPSTPPATSTPTGLVVPDFAGNGVSFITAREQLMALKIQGLPVFLGGAGDDTVVRTDPARGSPMARGATIKLYVNEPAPLLGVPNELTKDCNAAGSDVARVGFRPAYVSGRTGVVIAQIPAPSAPDAHWNDTINLTCGTPPPPSPSADPSPSDSASPSVSSSS
jgi:hypothetical protein